MAKSLDVGATLPTDWTYVNEGGATMVFAYTGPDHTDFTGNVLRLRKVDILNYPLGWNDEDDSSIAFHELVALRLVPAQFLPRLQSINLNQAWLENLDISAQESRPTFRTSKDRLDTTRSKGALATNIVGGKCITVEIKPKWGFLPNPHHLSVETREVKLAHCRYCMHSSLRAKAGDRVASGYCPLDLFSEDEKRIQGALESLWKGWLDSAGTLNNLRIFVDGKKVTPADTDAFGVIRTRLLEGTEPHDVSELLISRLERAISRGSLFSILQRLQRSLDTLDIEGLLQLWSHYREQEQLSTFDGVGQWEPTLDDWSVFLDSYLASDHSVYHELPDSSLETVRYHVLSHVLSATFKDCSVLLRVESDEVKTSMYVIDLDPKSVRRLDKWLAQDREIALAFDPNSKAPCRDANAPTGQRSSK